MIFFDMDGVVIDSEKLHLRALGLTLEKNGISFQNSILDGFVGRSDQSFFQYVYENIDDRIDIEDFLKQKNAHFESLMSEIQFVDGFTDFMRIVKDAKIKTALVTSSSKYTVQKVDKLLDFCRSFDIVITEEDTIKHKPHPDPYLLALERSVGDRKSTVIIEDSINGILAGKAAECIVYGLTTSFDVVTLKNVGVDFVYDSYKELAASLLVSGNQLVNTSSGSDISNPA
ncbi:MAG: HAD family phosphatase [Proteiniphilum sp.]